jgi:hypothetical protein
MNKNENDVGRPRKYATPEDFRAKCLEYFEWCKANNEPRLITGLALHLDFCSRQEFYNYADYDGFKEVVAWARVNVELAYEKRLQEAKPTGAIFALKNMGWRDERHVDVKSSDGSMTPKAVVSIDTSKLTTDQLAALYQALTVTPVDAAVIS